MTARRLCGTLAPIVAFGGILLATWMDPTFSWTTDALSHLGVRPDSAAIFNGALILGGLVGLPYAHLLVERARSIDRRWKRLVSVFLAVIFALALVGLVGVGVFPAGHPLHLPAAVGFYLGATACFLLDGIVRWNAPSGRATLGLVPLHVACWWTWAAGWWPGPGLALPEFVGALIVTAWVWWLGPVPTLRTPERDPSPRRDRG